MASKVWHRSLLDTVKQARQRGLCLYGAGFWGEITYKVFSRIHDLFGYLKACRDSLWKEREREDEGELICFTETAARS